jgi:hypothetical protein
MELQLQFWHVLGLFLGVNYCDQSTVWVISLSSFCFILERRSVFRTVLCLDNMILGVS